mgnify:CR=1 FL=1
MPRRNPVIVLFTDFGYAGPYVGQMKAVLAQQAPGVAVIDLMHDAPAFRPEPAAYLLAAAAGHLPTDAVLVAVVDPGVGTERAALAIAAGDGWLVGPDNGLLAVLAARRGARGGWRLPLPARTSASFHGRDLFAPAGGALAVSGELPAGSEPVQRWIGQDWPAERAEVVYLDGYGNAMTGLQADSMAPGAGLEVTGRRLPGARTFAERPAGTPFWYPNSLGLVEVAANQASAAGLLGLEVGAPVTVIR